MEKVNTNFTCLYSNPPVTLTHLTALVSDTRHGDAAALAAAVVAHKHPPKPVPRSSPQRMIHSNQLAAKAYLHGAYVLDPPSTRHVRRRGSPWWAMPCRGRGAAGRLRRCRTIALWPAKLRAEPRPAFVPLPAWLSAPRELALVDGLPPRVQLRGSPARRRRTFVRCKCCSDAFAHISLPSQQGHHTSSTCCS